MNIIIFLIAILFTLVVHWMSAQCFFSVDKHINKLKTSILNLYIHEKTLVVMVQRNISELTHYHLQIKGPPPEKQLYIRPLDHTIAPRQ